MKPTQRSPWILALLATFAGTSGADVQPGAGASRLGPPLEAGLVPATCQKFLDVPADARTDDIAWQQRVSLAACRQSISLAPVADAPGLLAALDHLDRAMAPSIAIYRDAMARAPDPIRIQAAYGLGLTYIDTMVRARDLIRSRAAYGGATYGGAWLDRPALLRAMLEPLLVAKREAALAAFDEVARIAEIDPAAARANPAVVYAIADARAKTWLLR